MDRLWYLLDLSLALPLLLNGFDAFIAALGVCVFISFSMRGYEGITFSDPDKQKASSLGSVVLSCLFGALLIRLSPWIALPTLALTALRYFFLYRLSHESFNEEKLMLIEREPIETKKTYDRIKRVLDIVLGVTILVLFGPVIGVIVLTSVISSGRPVFICQKRIGKDCREFEMYKFRTFETKAGKDRITRLGRFLRPLRLDELSDNQHHKGRHELSRAKARAPIISQPWNGEHTRLPTKTLSQTRTHRLGADQLQVHNNT